MQTTDLVNESEYLRPRSFLNLFSFCAYIRPRYQVSVYRTIGPLVFSSVWVADWPLFGKQLLTRLTIYSICILTIFPVLVSREAAPWPSG